MCPKPRLLSMRTVSIPFSTRNTLAASWPTGFPENFTCQSVRSLPLKSCTHAESSAAAGAAKAIAQAHASHVDFIVYPLLSEKTRLIERRRAPGDLERQAGFLARARENSHALAAQVEDFRPDRSHRPLHGAVAEHQSRAARLARLRRRGPHGNRFRAE